MTPTKPRYIMIGGFLGAGKSTSVARLARRLKDDGLRVGVIVNDQGSELVDGVNLRAQGHSVEEIVGGCFCCRFDSLTEAANRLTEADRPDVFVAEPVGSCTDLVATVSYPLRRLYGDDYTIAPYSVLLDPIRAMRVLGLTEGRSFSEKVLYIYRKQLEEADVLVANKIDLIGEADRARLREALEREFPKATVMEVSARTGEGLDAWFDRLLVEELGPGTAMDVDYGIYAEGEALMGWLNCTLAASATEAFDGAGTIESLAESLRGRLGEAGGEIAHLKMTLSPLEGFAASTGEVAVVNVVRNDFVPEVGCRIPEPTTRARIVLNLRAEADPETLRSVVESEARESAAKRGVALSIEHMEAFKPGKPVPTHRIEALA